MGKQKEAIDYLEQARDESFRASRHIMVITCPSGEPAWIRLEIMLASVIF
jgi:hypothetical protein